MIRIKILGWEEFNPRKDYKSTPWLRLQASLPAHRKMHGLSTSQKWLWVVVLCLVAQENQGGVLKIEAAWLADIAKVDEAIVVSTLRLFSDREMIELIVRDVRETYVGRSVDDLSTNGHLKRTFATNERTNERNEHPKSETSSPTTSKNSESQEDLDLADQWSIFAQEVSRTVKPNREKWAATFRLMRTVDGLTDAEIREMLAFVRTSDFWKVNAASATGLRSRSKNDLMKHENIRAAMRKPALGFQQPLHKVREIKRAYTEADID